MQRRIFCPLRKPYLRYFSSQIPTATVATDLGGDAETAFSSKRRTSSGEGEKHYTIIREPEGKGVVEVRAWLGDSDGQSVEIDREARSQLLKLAQLSRRRIEGKAGSPAPLPAWMRNAKSKRALKSLEVDDSEILQHPIAVMPDVHFGKGTTVGTVIPTYKAVIPSAVGVDIGCGMLALKTSLRHADLCGGIAANEAVGGKETLLANLRMAIEIAIPHGRTHNGGDTNDAGGWRSTAPSDVADVWTSELESRFKRIVAKNPTIERSNHVNHLGTLGTGNHFIEICIEEEEEPEVDGSDLSADRKGLTTSYSLQSKHSAYFGGEADEVDRRRHLEAEQHKQRGGNVWILLHSGSRGVGGKIGSTFIDIAKREMGNHYSNLPNGDLAYLREGNPHFYDYCEAISWAQDYARWNRELMATRVLKALRATKGIPKDFTTVSKAVNCHHNYVERIDVHTCKTLPWQFGKSDTTAIVDESGLESAAVYLTRKGATSARAGELAIIPGSMGARSFIVQGRGNTESYCSCSHGAGRRHSRGEAKRRFTLADHEAAMQGVQCRLDADVVDETPMAYKDIDSVMKAQADLVDVVAVLKQVLCVKG